MRALALLLLAIVLSSVTAGRAQEKGKSPPAAKDGKKKVPLDAIPGYKVHKIQGFTVVVSQEVLAAETKGKRTPLEALELELKNVAGLMNAKAVDVLRKVPIWAEWNERITVGNGRGGTSYATYYGGNQLQMLSDNMDPQKAKCIVIHLTKMLTESYEKKDRPTSLVVLHEMAHAVHDQLLGFEHPGIKTAYQQAMARKLYDKSLYCATNDAEFFAEMTCAFLDVLEYEPKTREALKAHDPATFKLMESIWGKAATPAAAGAKAKRPPNGSDDFDLSITVDKLKIGKTISGPTFRMPREGEVLLLVYTSKDLPAVPRKMGLWHHDYAPYGLLVVACGADYDIPGEDQAAAFKKLGMPFTLLAATFIPQKGGRAKSEAAGHAMLFSHAGTCVFRGSVEDVPIYVKEAIGAKLHAGLGLPDETPKLLKPSLDALLAGDPLPAVLAKVSPLANSTDAAVAEIAKKLVAAIGEPSLKLLADAEAKKKESPLEAFLIAEAVAASFKGTSVAAKAGKLTDALRSDKSVLQELKARKDLEAIRRIEMVLSSQPGSFDPASPRFRAQHAVQLAQMKTAYDAMKKNHPDAKATEQAAAIAKEYGVE